MQTEQTKGKTLYSCLVLPDTGPWLVIHSPWPHRGTGLWLSVQASRSLQGAGLWLATHPPGPHRGTDLWLSVQSPDPFWHWPLTGDASPWTPQGYWPLTVSAVPQTLLGAGPWLVMQPFDSTGVLTFVSAVPQTLLGAGSWLMMHPLDPTEVLTFDCQCSPPDPFWCWPLTGWCCHWTP